MKKEDSKELSKLSNSIVSKTMEIERLDLLYDMRDFLGIISNAMKPYDFFDTLRLSVKEAHDKEKVEFVTTIYKFVILPVPADFTLWIETPLSRENRYELYQGESTEIERRCRKIYYSNDANPGVEENIRIHVFGRW